MKTKKRICMLLCLAAVAVMAGCGNNNESSNRSTNNQKSVKDVLQAGMDEANGNAESDDAETDAQADDSRQSGLSDNAPEPVVEADENTVLSSTEGIDIDLTSLSSTMVYSEVYNMMYEPENYVGKTIKMDGLFTAYHDESTGNYYFACIIQDATACCAQGMEFILTEDHSYPDDYPEEGEQITVVGVFDTYMESDYTYCILTNAKLDL